MDPKFHGLRMQEGCSGNKAARIASIKHFTKERLMATTKTVKLDKGGFAEEALGNTSERSGHL